MGGTETPAGPPPRPRSIAEKLDRLFAVLHPAGGKPLTTREVAARVKQQGGSISPAYLSELRTGVKTNPSLDHVLWLAAAFGVSAGYFTDPEVAERVDQDLDRLEARHHHAQLAELAERTAGLEPHDRAKLAALVEDYLSGRRGSGGSLGRPDDPSGPPQGRSPG